VPAWRAPRTLGGSNNGVEVLGRDEAATGVVTSFLLTSLAPSTPSAAAAAARVGTGTSLSAGVGVTSASEDVFTSLVGPEAASFVSEGSGRHSRFDRLQRGQTQSLDLEHSRCARK
jgi:hypothetical protein